MPKKHKVGAPTKFHKTRVDTIIVHTAFGMSLKDACQLAGIHISTFCRWINKRPNLGFRLDHARKVASRIKYSSRLRQLRMPILYECPFCGGALEIRTAYPGIRFWKCRECEIQSWRFPAPYCCPVCRSPTLYSHSKKSVQCVRCASRTRITNFASF